MSTWSVLTETEVTEALPTDMVALYETWITTNPEKAGRLGELTLEAVAACRAAVECGSPGALDPDETMVPTSGFRHMVNTVIFNLGLEMSYALPGEFFSLVTRADIWLRGVQIGSVVIPPADGVGPSPSYEAPEGEERALEGM